LGHQSGNGRVDGWAWGGVRSMGWVKREVKVQISKRKMQI
jgi:hypothetical protein